MRTEAALRRDAELARERRRRQHVRDAYDCRLARILKLKRSGMTNAEIGAAMRLDRSRIGQILRAARELAELEAQIQAEAA